MTPAAPESQFDDASLVLTHARLIDGTGAAPVADATVIITGDRIVQAGAAKLITAPTQGETLDLSGCTLLPGFINAHVHKSYDAEMLKAWARGGVTTVRDLAADPRLPLFALRDELNARPSCARLVSAGPMITVPGGYPMVPWSSPVGVAVTSVQDASDQVHALLDAGADLIKIAVESGGCFNRTIPTLSHEQILAIVAAAHGRDMRVSAHILDTHDLVRALDGGVDDLAHMVVDAVSKELLQRAVEQGMVWVPTLELWHGVNESFGRRAIANLERFVDLGGDVALGTDYAGYYSQFDLGMPRREIGWLRAAGLSPLAIITAATHHAARVCNLGSRVGTLEPGKLADMIAVEGDPLADLEALARIVLVVRAGQDIFRGGRQPPGR